MARWHRLVLCAIVLGAAALSTYWVFLVPIYQSPDEPLHLDYALGLHAHRGLFHGHESPAPRMNNRLENIYTHDYVHPYTNHLMDQGGAGPIAFNWPAKVAPDYGTPEFFDRLDRQAPDWRDIEVREAPFLFRLYPFGYYALLAGWIEVLRRLDPQLSFVFFGARMFSVILLVGTLPLSYGTLRALQIGRGVGLAITAVIGFFPLTSFISSYVQPDNLSLFLTSACFYLSLQVQRRLGCWRNHALLGLALGMLLVTKVHYFLAVAGPVAGLLAGQLWNAPLALQRRLAYASLVSLPAVGLGLVHISTQGNILCYFQPPPVTLSPARHVWFWSQKAFSDFYLGLTHRSFWGNFGWLDTPLVMHDPVTTRVVGHFLAAAGLVFLGLTCVRGVQVAWGLTRLVQHGRRRSAWRIAFSNPVLNSYFAFTALMFAVYVRYQNAFGGQGRNWLPFLLPFVLTGAVYVPRLLRRPRYRLASAVGLLAALLTFDGIGGYYAIASVRQRYYAPYQGQALRRLALTEVLQSLREKQRQTITLGAPRYVHGLQLCYAFTHFEQNRSTLTVTWTRPDGVRQSAIFHVIHDRSKRTLTTPIGGIVESITLELGDDPSRLDLYTLELLCPSAREWTARCWK